MTLAKLRTKSEYGVVLGRGFVAGLCDGRYGTWHTSGLYISDYEHHWYMRLCDW